MIYTQSLTVLDCIKKNKNTKSAIVLKFFVILFITFVKEKLLRKYKFLENKIKTFNFCLFLKLLLLF
jgi:hypothetical protein